VPRVDASMGPRPGPWTTGGEAQASRDPYLRVETTLGGASASHCSSHPPLSSCLASRQEVQLARLVDGLPSAVNAELAEDVLEVRLHRVDRDAELGRDLCVRHHRGQESEDDQLAIGQ